MRYTSIGLIFVSLSILSMIVSIPASVLDFGLAISFSFSIMILGVVVYSESPIEFSAFPVAIVVSLILRLCLNVSSTKLIISEGHSGTSAAGNVIEGFSQFVMQDDTILGIVIFCVLLIVNFVVITKGATRMAEVSARFALDGMPGRQMAIDSDLSSGAISQEEAHERRIQEHQEAAFFGSLDGASKFVKGDAIAGLLIVLLNLVVGILVGVLNHGMDFGTAFDTYSILTVGDGLVTQLPAIIVSISSALLLSRSGAKSTIDRALLDQIGRNSQTLISVGVILIFVGALPGLPMIPFLLGAMISIACGLYVRSRKNLSQIDEISDEVQEKEQQILLGDLLDLDEVHVFFCPDLAPIILDPLTGMDARISSMRVHIAESYGIVLPGIRLSDDPSLPLNQYSINVQGVEVTRNTLRPGRLLAISTSEDQLLPAGEDVLEPVYSANARWIPTEDEEQASLVGATVVSPAEVLATHLLEVVKENFPRIFNFKSLRVLLDEFVSVSDSNRAQLNRKLLDDFIPEKVPVELLLAVMKALLAERVSIRNVPLILEGIAETRGTLTSHEQICEFVRQKLGFQIVAQWRRSDGSLPLIQLVPEWEEKFRAFQVENDRGRGDVALPPDEFGKLSSGISGIVNGALESGIYPVLVASAGRRRFLKTVVSASGIKVPVLSFEELGVDARPSLVGTVPC